MSLEKVAFRSYPHEGEVPIGVKWLIPYYKSGVPQGSVVVELLYLFISDLPNFINAIMLHFVDTFMRSMYHKHISKQKSIWKRPQSPKEYMGVNNPHSTITNGWPVQYLEVSIFSGFTVIQLNRNKKRPRGRALWKLVIVIWSHPPPSGLTPMSRNPFSNIGGRFDVTTTYKVCQVAKTQTTYLTD